MDGFATYSGCGRPYLGANLGWTGCSRPYNNNPSPIWTHGRPWDLHFPYLDPGDILNFGSPYSPPYRSTFDFGPRPVEFSPTPNPTVLWMRGVLSPCLRHDHHIVTNDGSPPFSAGTWEIDRRHMIEVQFDQFGIASDCRSTWGRMGPWRANRYRYGVEEACVKLQSEMTMLLLRLGFDAYGGWNTPSPDFRDMHQPWARDYEYEYPMGNDRYAHLPQWC